MILLMLSCFVVTYPTWIYGVIARLRHSGRVCSGDFLKKNDKTEGYLIGQGMGLYVYFVLIIIMLALAIVPQLGYVICKFLKSKTRGYKR